MKKFKAGSEDDDSPEKKANDVTNHISMLPPLDLVGENLTHEVIPRLRTSVEDGLLQESAVVARIQSCVDSDTGKIQKEREVPCAPERDSQHVESGCILEYYAGQSGREKFFEIARMMQRQQLNEDHSGDWANWSKPASPDHTAKPNLPLPAMKGLEGAAAREFVKGLQEASLPPRPILSRAQPVTKKLNLSSFGLGDGFGNALAQSLWQLREFEEISLADNNLTDASLVGMLRTIMVMHRLRFLDLSRNAIDEAGATALRRFVADQSCALETLKLVHADVDDNECRLLCEAIASNPKCQLRMLDLSENLIGVAEGRNVVNPEFFTGAEALAEVIEAECPNSLEFLNLSWNYIRGDSAFALARALAKNSKLKVLNLNYNAFGDVPSQEIGRSLTKNSTLEVLKLSNNNVTPRATFVIAHSLRRAVDSKLRQLELSGNSPGHTGGRAMLQAVRDREGALAVKMENCIFISNKEQTLFFDSSVPEGKYELDMSSAYDRVVACELLRIATIRDGCRFAYLAQAPPSPQAPISLSVTDDEDEAPQRNYCEVKLTQKETTPETDRAELWRPIIDHILKQGNLPREDLLRVLKKCRLNPSSASIDRILVFVDSRLTGFFAADRNVRELLEARYKTQEEAGQTQNYPKTITEQNAVMIDVASGEVEVDEDAMSHLVADDQPNAEKVLEFESRARRGSARRMSHRDEAGAVMPEVSHSAAKAISSSASVERRGSRFKGAVHAVRFHAILAKHLGKFKPVHKSTYSAARTGHHDKLVLDGQNKLTYEVVLALIFRGAFRVVDQDNSGKLDGQEIKECGKLLGLEIDSEEANRIIVGFDDGDGLLSESEFVSYMLSLFLLPPDRVRGPLLDCSTQEPWAPPEIGFLSIVFESDPSIPSLDEVGSDEGVEGLLKIIRDAPTDTERAIMFEMATDRGANGGYFTAAQAQRVIDTCGQTARLDKYDLCRRLSETMASPADCSHIIGANLTPALGVALWCEVGPAAFRWCVGNLTGSYAMDLSVHRDRSDFLRLAGSVHAERIKSRNDGRPDTSQRGSWSGGFRNVRINGLEIEDFDPLNSIATLPKKGIITFDVVSLTRPFRTDKPISGLRFAALLKSLRASEWKDAAKATAAEVAALRRACMNRTAPVGSTIGGSASLWQSNLDDSLHLKSTPVNPGKQSPTFTKSRRKTVGASTASDNKAQGDNYTPVWPSRRGHRLLSVENVVSYYSQLRETSTPEGFYDTSRPVRYNRICIGSGVGRAIDDRDLRSLPSPRALSWIHLRLVELEFHAIRLLFSAQQVFALWNHLPTGSEWADIRVQLVCILFRRTIDIENLPTVLFPNIAIEDLCQIRCRLGSLNLLSSRSPDGFHRYRLHLYDEREAIRILVELAFHEPGENWADSRYRRSQAWAGNDWMPGWSLPATWIDHMAEEGTVELTYVSRVPDWSLRDSLMSRLLCGAKLLVESKMRMTAAGTILRR